MKPDTRFKQYIASATLSKEINQQVYGFEEFPEYE
jgi:hypothetical protein